MPAPARPVIETRYGQMFPVLEPAEVDRLHRFGERRAYRAGERLVTTGEVSPGMFVVLRGEVAISQHNPLGHSEAIVTHGPGSFIGELTQLSSRPSLVDAKTRERIYQQTDTHWNDRGALVAYQRIIAAAHARVPRIPPA